MTKKKKAVYKKILAFILSLCMVLGGFITNVMPVRASVVFYASDKDLKPYQSEISNWSSGCHICSVAMVLTAMGKSNSTPYEVWKNNNRNVSITWDNIQKNYDVKTSIGYLSGNSNDKYNKIYSLCQQYPYGIDLYAPYTNNNGVQQSHYVYAFIENGTLYIHNPGYTSWSYRIVGKNATHYDDYSNFQSYRVFTANGTGTVTPTPTPTQDPITFQTPTYSNVTETTAYVETKVTADCSQLSKVGMIWNEVVGGTYRSQTDFSWTVGNKLTKISVDFGKEKDKNGNIPTLSPGTTYECNFFAVTKTGKILYSTAVRFTTKSTALRDTIPPAISNVKVTPTNGGYYVECDVYDNVGVTKVAFPTWSIKNGQDDLQTPWPVGEAWSHKSDGSATYVIKINASDHNNEEGYYATHIYAYDAAGNQSMVAVSPDTYVDRTAPTISDIKIIDQTNAGYTVQCKVTDNVGVSKVQFPTWTEKNGQDDIIWGEGTKNGDIYSYRVNISDHNNEYGIYHTHIYAYDAMGNQRSAAAPDCTINAITITQQPNSYMGTVGDTAKFKIAATGSNLKYQWQYKTVGSNNWINCNSAGSTTPELRFIITNVNDNQTEFRCVVSDNSNTVISQSATLSVLKDTKKYTVTFDSQGGTLVNAITNIVENTKIASLPNPPTRDHFEFIGWYTEPNGRGRVFDENTVVSGDMTVYAYWKLQTTNVPNGFWVNDIPAQRYTGKAIKPFIEVYDGKKLLTEKVDYTLSYKNNIKANDASNAKTAPTVVVKGKGNYSGTETVTFTILAKNIGGEDVTIDNITKAYSNSLQKVVPTVTWNGKKLKNKTDFTVRYPETDENAYIAEGKYQIEIIGKGNYTGRKVVWLTITNKKLMSKVSVAKIPNQPYTGNKITPELTVKDGKTQLQENVDYSISYSNNLEIGTATVVLTGIGSYCGEKRISFKITGIDIKKAAVENMPKSVMYMGNSITVSPHLVIVSDDSELSLQENRDYTISYQKNKDVGTATVIFKGINNYSGTLKKTFNITSYNIAEDVNSKIKVEENIKTSYAIGGSKPKLEIHFGTRLLTEGIDYTLKYSNNKAVSSSAVSDDLPMVTICGKGNFSGSLSTNFEIAQQKMGALRFEVSDKVYQNKAGKWKSIPKITDLNGKTLKAGRDYESEILYTYIGNVTLSDGVNKVSGSRVEPTDIPPAGTKILVTVTGKGNYTGKRYDSYRITQFDICKAKVKIPKQIYTGREIYPDKDQIEVRIGKTVLADTDYEIVDYSNNIKKGTATIVIRGTGNYGGTKKATFKITAKGFKWWWK
ncbi:MAG: hypothetical protein HDR09_11020 [Lachnospiraceae bacterium]|nr:hypothetical protein [Lachnospiraceae bacterium]